MQNLERAEACVDAVLATVGRDIRLGTPLGLGKPNHLLNALYRRAKADPSISLKIFTALTLARPETADELEERFLSPLRERLWAGHPDLEYEADRRAGKLPANVRVIEFYLQAGEHLENPAAQRDYISTNYTLAARDLLDQGVNVLCQQVARRTVDGMEQLSLSCNADVSLDLAAGLDKSGRPHLIIGQINQQLPFMVGDAVVAPSFFDILIDNPEQYAPLFGTPKTEISDQEYLIGLYASTLIRDGGELQIGIGGLSDALVYALLLRQNENAVYNEVLQLLGIRERYAPLIERIGQTGPFSEGLFAATEMMGDGFMHLMRAGVVKRKVYDDVPLQRLLNAQQIGEKVQPQTLDALLAARAIGPVLSASDFAYLQHWGILRRELRFVSGQIVLADGTRIDPDLTRLESRTLIDALCLDETLRHGRAVHAGFFLGPQSFYTWLRELPDDQRALIDMRSVRRINQLYGHEEIDRLHLRNARFVNTTMVATLLGGACSDTIEGGQVVSGVGGQYNFVAMAHALPEGRSLIQLRSTRETAGTVTSNIVYQYGHLTIPRHLRDLVITEYGIADLRGKTDEEVIKEMLSIADSRFQPALLARARRHGKIDRRWRLPDGDRTNHPERFAPILAQLRQRGLFPRYPFGTELTEHEVVLARALRALKGKVASMRAVLKSAAAVFTHGYPDDSVLPYLERMGLGPHKSPPLTPMEGLYARLLTSELKEVLKGALKDGHGAEPLPPGPAASPADSPPDSPAPSPTAS
ncbi:MAG: acetyl-CoA hydrolase/transferase C-terminal domain-containing protein [Polyangia bacterium]